MGLRLAVARQHGLDEAMADAVDHYADSDLTPGQQLALRFTDAFVTSPAAIDVELRAQLRGHYSVAQLVELALDASKWSTQKIQVSLGLDAPVIPGGLAELDFDADGHPIIGGPVPGTDASP